MLVIEHIYTCAVLALFRERWKLLVRTQMLAPATQPFQRQGSKLGLSNLTSMFFFVLLTSCFLSQRNGKFGSQHALSSSCRFWTKTPLAIPKNSIFLSKKVTAENMMFALFGALARGVSWKFEAFLGAVRQQWPWRAFFFFFLAGWESRVRPSPR